MTTIKDLTDTLAARKEVSRAAYTAYYEAQKQEKLAADELFRALITASGRKPGDILKGKDGAEYKISHLRFHSESKALIAACHDRTKTGAWSQATRASVTINVSLDAEV